ncbi:restriction endonuclease fold toxin 5 domain-containing protein [Denitromonas iodatirespirans]|uniref:Tox-REase-5 domain-containing protein n=1 Tax=Denitromonas iodatirespirans TaxID=2795389 RepID=A0A944HE54_DENI1|nr:restriction endonuclease fold toxin 5 domain-containing protein [Denitromonas iodatirespirans]MBT0962606.1 hypothetical protein [Denitromonas iodatirespirans]
MASLAIPTIEAVALRVLAALGVGVATGAADQAAREQARKRQEAAEKAKSAPISRTEAPTGERKKCAMCPPDCGTEFERTFPVRKDWVDYQARIGGMPNGPNFIMEWEFNGVKFDGFVSAECMLKEAKGGYDRFFDEWGEVFDWWRHNINEMMREMGRQSLAATPRPPVQLEWLWQEPVSYRYFSKILGPIAPDVPHHYFP